MRDSIIWSIAISVLIIAGCVSSPGPVNQTNNTSAIQPPEVRYIQLNMIDGSSIGGVYVSETSSFVTIIPLYVMQEKSWTNKSSGVFHNDPEYLTNGSGITMGIKISLINTMIDIPDPHPFIIAKLKSQNERVAAEERAYEAQQEAYRIAAEKREAEQAKYQGKAK